MFLVGYNFEFIFRTVWHFKKWEKQTGSLLLYEYGKLVNNPIMKIIDFSLWVVIETNTLGILQYNFFTVDFFNKLIFLVLF